MKFQRNYRLDERTIKRLDEMAKEFGSDCTTVLEDAVRLYYMVYKCPDGTVWNMDEIKSIM